jgi:hypothetical protein
MNSVEMLNQTIYRPSYIGVSEWFEFWEHVRDTEDEEKDDES